MVAREAGQAAVELLASVPAIALGGLISWQLVLVGHAAWETGNAARVAARADLVSKDPRRAAHSAVARELGGEVKVERLARGGARVRRPLPLERMRWGREVRISAATSLEAVP